MHKMEGCKEKNILFPQLVETQKPNKPFPAASTLTQTQSSVRMTAITNQYKCIPKVQEENYELTMDQTPENIKGLAMKHRGCYKREEAKHYLFEFDFLLPKGT